MNKISIITATYNSESTIKALIKSLESQSDQNFDWFIADNCSTDQTIKIINNVNKFNVNIISEQDKGIYDALNKAIKRSKNKFYLVVGSDDYLSSDCVENFRKSINENVDLIFSAWKVGNKISYPKKKLGVIYGMLGVGSCHSVATLIKKSLHEKWGYYDLQFKVCADQYFIKKSVYGGAVCKHMNFVSGEFSNEGFSSINTLNNLSEFFKIQLLTEKNKLFQFSLFILRIIKNYKKL